MMNKWINIFLLIVVSSACQERTTQSELKSLQDKQVFLEEIFNSDQAIRKNSKEIELKYGDDSQEYYEVVAEMNIIDDSNLEKITWYLDNYDYPDSDSFDDSLSRLPALVVHHSNNEGVRRSFYPKFKTAYEQGVLVANFFALYLGRMYQMEKGSYYRMKSPYMIEDQIDSLIVQLDL